MGETETEGMLRIVNKTLGREDGVSHVTTASSFLKQNVACSCCASLIARHDVYTSACRKKLSLSSLSADKDGLDGERCGLQLVET